MKNVDPDLESKSLVLVGHFNPQIFQPTWLEKEGLIRRSEAEGVEIEIIHPEIAILNFDGYSLRVTRDRFALSTLQTPFHPVLRDLVIGAFGLLRHTPVHLMGINAEAHFKMASVAAWHKFGHRLAPKDGLWDGLLKAPGMQSLTIQGERDDGYTGYTRVKVEPSPRFLPGLHFSINDHYSAENKDECVGCEEIVTILGNVWEDCASRAREVFSRLYLEANREP